jgi:hypothetical protein
VALACDEAGAVNELFFSTEGHVAHTEIVYTIIVQRPKAERRGPWAERVLNSGV